MSLKDVYFTWNPVSWRHAFKRAPQPTALQLASADLEQCRVDRLENQRQAEYHAAMTKMLEQREKRLQADVQVLSARVVNSQLDAQG